MYVELRGVGFTNKGAELMLRSILTEVRKRHPEAIFVMEYAGLGALKKQVKLGIRIKFNSNRYSGVVNTISNLSHDFLLNSLNFVKEEQVDLILDGSGFVFGDIWGGDKAAHRLGNYIEEWKKNGKYIVLLPQAFGPFNDPDVREEMKHIIKYSDLIYARDPVSFEYIKELNDTHEGIYLKPDFSNLVDGIKPRYLYKNKYEVAIIPNFKMIETTSAEIGNAYPDFLRKSINAIKKSGFSPFFLIHSGEKDKILAQEVNHKLEAEIPIIDDDDPLKVKGIIGASRMVITSRFHGLASALSQAVPCLTTGWSHKYQMILDDYDYPEGMCEVLEEGNILEKKISSLLEPAKHKEIHVKLHKNAKKQKELSKQMWDEIFEFIK